MRTPSPILLIFLALIMALAGCDNERAGKSADQGSLGTWRPTMTPAVAYMDSIHQVLVAEAVPDAAFRNDYLQYLRLRRGIHNVDTRAAYEDSLFFLWESEPSHFLWFEVSQNKKRFLTRLWDSERIVSSVIEPDSNSAVSQFFLGRLKIWDYPFSSAAFIQAESPSLELNGLQRIWVQYRLAYVESQQGKQQEAVTRLLRVYATAWDQIGPEMCGSIWNLVSLFSRKQGNLDNALVAANNALRCAEFEKTGFLACEANINRGRALEERGEFERARQVFNEILNLAEARGHSRWQREAVGGLTRVAFFLGDFEIEKEQSHRTRVMAVAIADTHGIIRSQLSLSSLYLDSDTPDSGAYWVRRADFLDRNSTTTDMARTIRSQWAWVHSSYGQYDLADSLLAVSLARDEASGDIQALGKMLISHIKRAETSGRIDQEVWYLNRALALKPHLFIEDGLTDPAWDLELLSAGIRARQGDFVQARKHLETASEHPLVETSLIKEYRLNRTRAEVAELSGDFAGAAEIHRLNIKNSRSRGSRSGLNNSQVKLGRVLLKRGLYSEARELFAPNRQSTDYWPSLVAELYTGMAWSREGQWQQADQAFSRVQGMLGPDAPINLVNRLRLEKAKVAAQLHNPEEAFRLIQSIQMVEEGPRYKDPNEVVRIAQLGLSREITEQALSLFMDHPDLLEDVEGAAGSLDFYLTWMTDVTKGPYSLFQGADPMTVYFLGEYRAFQWFGHQGNIQWVELPDPKNLVQRAQDLIVDMEYPGREVDWALAESLGADLLKPLEKIWDNGQTLQICPDGVLYNLPWAAIPLGKKQGDSTPLIVDFGPIEISELGFENKVEGNENPVDRRIPGRPLLVMANNGDPRQEITLKMAEKEGQAVTELWSSERVDYLSGDGTRWDHLISLPLADYGAIHIASHASFQSGSSEYATLQLAGAGETGLGLQQIRNLPLQAQLVYLSSCETSRLDQDRASGLDSFLRAFLAAGSEAVVASSIRIDDEASLALALEFHRAWLGGETRAAALQAAQVKFRSDNSQWQHPYFWAFTTIHAGR